MKVVISQKGAREHYAVARALHQEGLLARLVVDWYAPGNPVLRRVAEALTHVFGGRGRSAMAARLDLIPDRLVKSFPLSSLLWKWQVRQGGKHGRQYEAFAATDAAFARSVGRLDLPAHEVFFGYSYASLETLEAERRRGVFTVLDQIDPGALEFQLVAAEMSRHPEIAGPPPKMPVAYFDRVRREWELADVIIVNSEWSREALVQQGVPAGKIEVLPLAYGLDEVAPPGPEGGGRGKTESLRVLWLGQVNLRKGIHYLMTAAGLLEGENIQFDVVGPSGILPAAIASAPKNMRFHGPVSRDQVEGWYRRSDVFVLPTLSDGFALTQLEALARGLPVVATPHCGRVVEHGKTGFIVPARDPQALAEALRQFARNPELAPGMAPHCRAAVKAYSIEACGRQLVGIIRRGLAARQNAGGGAETRDPAANLAVAQPEGVTP